MAHMHDLARMSAEKNILEPSADQEDNPPAGRDTQQGVKSTDVCRLSGKG